MRLQHNLDKSKKYADIAKTYQQANQQTLSQLYYFLAFDSQKNAIESILQTCPKDLQIIDLMQEAANLALLCGLPEQAYCIAEMGLSRNETHWSGVDKKREFSRIIYENSRKPNKNTLIDFDGRVAIKDFELTAAQVILIVENELTKENANIDFAKTYELLSILLSNLSNKGFSFDENFAQMCNNARILCKDISVSGNNTKISTYKQAKWCIGLLSSYIQDFDLKYPVFIVADCYCPQPIGLVQPALNKVYEIEKYVCYGERKLKVFTIARHKAAAENPKLFPIKGELVWGVPSIEKGKFFFVDESN